MVITQIIEKKEITFRGLEGEKLICNFEWEKPRMVNMLVEEEGKIVMRKRKKYFTAENVKIKMNTTNKELLEKANMLVEEDKVYMYFYVPKNVDFYDTDKWLILDLSDEIDLLEISNQNCLMTCDVPEKENIIEPKRKSTKKTNKVSKKDKKIAELEEENTMLRLQLQMFQQK